MHTLNKNSLVTLVERIKAKGTPIDQVFLILTPYIPRPQHAWDADYTVFIKEIKETISEVYTSKN